MATGREGDGSGRRRGGGGAGDSIQGSLNQVLQYAIANTSTDSPSQPREQEEREALTAEKKEFMEKVFAEMLRDEVKEMKEHIDTLKGILKSETEEDQETKEERLELLLDLCESIDNAQDFLKLGGTDVAMSLCKDPSAEVRWRALDLLATTVQNNPTNQGAMLDRGGLKMCLQVLDEDQSYQVRVKALYAVSCLVREHDAAQEALVEADGFSSLMRAMQSDVEKLQIKAAFLLSALLWEQPKFNDTLHNMGMVQQLIHILQGEHRMFHEHVMSAVLHLVSGHDGCCDDALNPQLGFRTFLENRVKELTGKEEFMEELDYSQKLLALFRKFAPQDGATSADR
ncbi:hsp70-binding protein 1-like [Diadema antillarum]|uniref:hsp70-binding protein 1-like n=1 Tax=Diadema antillarum TaxID=105358 RepID=UPI003A8660ED